MAQLARGTLATAAEHAHRAVPGLSRRRGTLRRRPRAGGPGAGPAGAAAAAQSHRRPARPARHRGSAGTALGRQLRLVRAVRHAIAAAELAAEPETRYCAA